MLNIFNDKIITLYDKNIHIYFLFLCLQEYKY